MGYSNRLWVCPYYTRDYKDHMSCEGGRVEFPSVKATRDYMARYCASNEWESCTLARALTEHYDEKETQQCTTPKRRNPHGSRKK